MAQELVKKYQLPVTKDDGMTVTLADGSLVTTSTLCQVPLVACANKGKAVAFGLECRVLPHLNHDVVLGVDWLSATNPTIDWQACTVALECVGSTAPAVLSGLPNTAVARVDLCSL